MLVFGSTSLLEDAQFGSIWSVKRLKHRVRADGSRYKAVNRFPASNSMLAIFCGGSYCFMSWCYFFVLLPPYV